MNGQQVQAFQQAAGTKISSLSYSIKLLIFFVMAAWVTWIVMSIVQSLKDKEVSFNMANIMRKIVSGLAIFAIVLIIIN